MSKEDPTILEMSPEERTALIAERGRQWEEYAPKVATILVDSSLPPWERERELVTFGGVVAALIGLRFAVRVVGTILGQTREEFPELSLPSGLSIAAEIWLTTYPDSVGALDRLVQENTELQNALEEVAALQQALEQGEEEEGNG